MSTSDLDKMVTRYNHVVKETVLCCAANDRLALQEACYAYGTRNEQYVRKELPLSSGTVTLSLLGDDWGEIKGWQLYTVDVEGVFTQTSEGTLSNAVPIEWIPNNHEYAIETATEQRLALQEALYAYGDRYQQMEDEWYAQQKEIFRVRDAANAEIERLVGKQNKLRLLLDKHE